MPNNTGLIFGDVRFSNGTPAAEAEVSLNWVLGNTDRTPVKTGGDDKLTSFVPKVKTGKGGKYAMPFFWEAAHIAKVIESGATTSVLGIWFAKNNAHTAANQQGRLVLGLDLRKLFGAVAPPLPSSGSDWAVLARDFHAAYRELLPKNGVFPMQPMFSTELHGLLGRIDIWLR